MPNILRPGEFEIVDEQPEVIPRGEFEIVDEPGITKGAHRTPATVSDVARQRLLRTAPQALPMSERPAEMHRLPTYLEAGERRMREMGESAKEMLPGLAQFGKGVTSVIAGDAPVWAPSPASFEAAEGAARAVGGFGAAVTQPFAPLGGMTKEYLARQNVPVVGQELGAAAAESLPQAALGIKFAQAARIPRSPVKPPQIAAEAAVRAAGETVGAPTMPREPLPGDMYRPVSPQEAAGASIAQAPPPTTGVAVQAAPTPRLPKAPGPAATPRVDVEDVARRHLAGRGSSTDLATGATFQPKSGFQVVTNPELTMTLDPMKIPQDIAAYLETPQVKAAMKKNPRLKLGTYVMEDTGEHVVELSEHVLDPEKARKLGAKHDQESIWDWSTNTSVRMDQPQAAPAEVPTAPAGGPETPPPAAAVPETGTIVPKTGTPEPAPAPVAAPPATLAPESGGTPGPARRRFDHYSDRPDLEVLNASRYGEGALSYSEKARGSPPGTYLYAEGADVEPKVRSRSKYKYKVEIPEDQIADITKFEGTPTDRERAIAALGHTYPGQESYSHIYKSFAPELKVVGKETLEEMPRAGTPAIAFADRATGQRRVIQSGDGMHHLAIEKLSDDELRAIAQGKAEFQAGKYDHSGKFVANSETTQRAYEYVDGEIKMREARARAASAPKRSLPPGLARAVQKADSDIAEVMKQGNLFDVTGATVSGAKLVKAYSVKAAAYIWEHAPRTFAEFRAGILREFPDLANARVHLRLIYRAAKDHLKKFFHEADGKLMTVAEWRSLVAKGDPFWYETGAQESRQKIIELFGPGADKEMAELAAVLSPNRSVRQSQRLVLDVMEARRTGEDFPLEATKTSGFSHYLATGEIRGPKTKPFGENVYAALEGKTPEKVPVDRHMVHGMGWEDRDVPRRPQRAFLEHVSEREARRAREAGEPADTPARQQAAFWGGYLQQPTKSDIKGSKEPFHRTMAEMITEREEGIRTALARAKAAEDERVAAAVAEAEGRGEGAAPQGPVDTSFDFGANVKEMHAGFPLPSGKTIREMPITAHLKKTLGTREERYQGVLGSFRGSEARAMEIQHEVKVGLRKRDATETIKQVTNGMSQEEHAKVFDTLEAIKELDAQGNPVFGTKEDIVPGTARQGQVRYTPAEGKKLWDSLTPQGKNATIWAAGERERLKAASQIIGNIEGYMHHFRQSELAGPWQKLKEMFGAPPKGQKALHPGMERVTAFRTKTAPQRKLRTGSTDFEHHFGKSFEKTMHDLIDEDEFNRFIKDFGNTVTEPIVGGQVRDGWKEIPKLASTRTPKIVGQMFGGRQIPAELWDDFVRHTEAAQGVHELASLTMDAANFFRTNLLALNPGTVGTNAVSGGLQYGTKLIHDFWNGVFSLDMSQFSNDIKAMFDALDPATTKRLPQEVFGARSNIRTQYARPQGILGKAGDVGMIPFAAVENFWKRTIAMSELRKHGVAKMTAEQLADHRQLLMEVNREIDRFAFNYAEVPKFIEKVRSSPVGALTVPFPVYFYKVSRMYGRYAAAFNPAVQMTTKERFARAMTLATIAAVVYPMVKGSSEKTKERGRMAVGGGLGLRTVKYPWAALANPKTMMEEGISVGPLGEAAADVMGYNTKYDLRRKPGVGAGEILGGFVPGSRITNSARDIIAGASGERRTQPQTFGQAFLRSVPFTPTLGKKKGKKLNPNLEVLKFMTGVNLQEGHRRER